MDRRGATALSEMANGSRYVGACSRFRFYQVFRIINSSTRWVINQESNIVITDQVFAVDGVMYCMLLILILQYLL